MVNNVGEAHCYVFDEFRKQIDLEQICSRITNDLIAGCFGLCQLHTKLLCKISVYIANTDGVCDQ